MIAKQRKRLEAGKNVEYGGGWDENENGKTLFDFSLSTFI